MSKRIRSILCLAVVFLFFCQTSAWRRRRRRRCASHSCSWTWRPCSKSCGSGVQYAVKTVSQGPCGSCSMPTSSKACNTHCCARNCAWLGWSNWSTCSRACGGGNQARSRGKTPQVCGGAACSGPSRESRSCNQKCCPVHCSWASWSSWGSCSKNCGGGVQTRNRGHSSRASCGGKSCAGSSTDTRSCNQQCCPVHCSWGSWGSWVTCTVTCGGGIQTRNRGYAIAASCKGNACPGKPIEKRSCSQGCCPVHCSWAPWNSWGSCSRNCGGGKQTRNRGQNRASCGGASCSGLSTNTRSCNQQCCAVHCSWASWGNWGACTASCGGGTQTRNRVSAVAASCNGNACAGASAESRTCNKECCPVHCSWASWGSWGTCSRNCGGGVQTRERGKSTIASCGGNSCPGSSINNRSCNQQCCPVDCSWDSWTNWEKCSKTCGGGTQSRSRGYSTALACGGKPCLGSLSESKSCNGNCCPVDCVWTAWNPWNSCSVSCGGGMQVRERGMDPIAFCGGSECDGLASERQTCNSGCCPIACLWDEWSDWSTCTKQCGSGIRKRIRTISVPSFCGGNQCSGVNAESQNCNTQCCPVDCEWKPWGAWSTCTKSCEKGSQTRTRDVAVESFCGGSQCQGSSNDTRFCNDVCCPVHCQWEHWSEWSVCTKTCNTGWKSRQRDVKVAAVCRGEECAGTKFENTSCSTQCCAVDCILTSWTAWAECSHSCGAMGTKDRHRAVKQKAECGGDACETDLRQIKTCNRFCLNSGNLTDDACTCDNGWTGECCQHDVNECAFTSCTTNSKCFNADGSYECVCDHGYTMSTGQCVDVDECHQRQHDCHEMAECINLNGHYNCRCHPGFSGNGTDCVDVDECLLENDPNEKGDGFDSSVENFLPPPCHDEATCINTYGSFECRCNTGYKGDGKTCEDVDECSLPSMVNRSHLNASTKVSTEMTLQEGGVSTSFPLCHIHARCVNTPGSYSCWCQDGYFGDGLTCHDINECSSGPCQNGGTCDDLVNAFLCTCRNGYTGELCQADIDECILNSDVALASAAEEYSRDERYSGPCHVNAGCSNVIGSYVCLCNNGYLGDGIICNEVDECKSNPCSNGATCVNLVDAYRCECAPGFMGLHCKADIDECSVDGDSDDDNEGLFSSDDNSALPLCHDQARCANTYGSYSCHCNPGYEGDGVVCKDINECSSGPCKNGGTCNDMVNAVTCTCPHGYTGDLCQNDIDECQLISEKLLTAANKGSYSDENSFTPCHVNAVCNNTIGSYACYCHSGYEGDGLVCEKIDVCRSDPCSNGATCVDLGNAFQCRCLPGFKGLHCEIDIDECRDGTHECDPENGKCISIPGSHKCICKKGFSGDGKTCTDINECSIGMYHCEETQNCLNNEGGYTCVCHDGYEMESGKCEDINECFLEKHCKENQECLNRNGGYSCVCNDGYEMMDGECKDLNECANGDHDCTGSYQSCKNLDGGYTCVCREPLVMKDGACEETIPVPMARMKSEKLEKAASVPSQSAWKDFTNALQKPSVLAIVILAGILLLAVVIFVIKVVKRNSTASFALRSPLPSITSDAATQEDTL